MKNYVTRASEFSTPLQWKKASRSSANGNCVEAAPMDHAVAVRDSKDPVGPALIFSVSAWNAFLHQVGR